MPQLGRKCPSLQAVAYKLSVECAFRAAWME